MTELWLLQLPTANRKSSLFFLLNGTIVGGLKSSLNDVQCSRTVMMMSNVMKVLGRC